MQGDQRDVVEVDGSSVDLEATWGRSSFWQDALRVCEARSAEHPWLLGVIAIVIIAVVSGRETNPWVSVTAIVSVLIMTVMATWRSSERERKRSDQSRGQ